jgi:RNA polymerase sigma-70 factor (ECF subfamily)
MWLSFGHIDRRRETAAMVDPSESALNRPTAMSGAHAAAAPSARAIDEIMNRYAQGEDGAFDELYRRGGPRVRGFLLRLCGEASLADDLVQESFLRVHRARGSFVAGAAALPWMLAIARNAFRDHIRRVQARPKTQGMSGPEGEERQHEAPPSARGDEALAARETLEVVRRTLAELPVLQREAFVLLRFEGLSVSEAASVLSATEGAVKVRAFRAYEALRAALARANADGAPMGGAK